MKITSNHHWRQPLSWCELTDEERRQFNYFDPSEEGEGSFIRYKGETYDLDDFMDATRIYDAATHKRLFTNWDGYHADSFFSGILVKWSDDGYEVKIGCYYS